MALLEINRNPSRRELRQFGCIWLPLFLLLAGAYMWYGTGWAPLSGALWIAAAGSILVGVAAPALLKWIFVGWLTAAYPIGWVVSHTILAAVYYLVMTPIGLARRIGGYDALTRRFNRSAPTYWVDARRARGPSQYFRQF